MTAIKLIVADLDDTLLNARLEITKEIKEAVSLAREKGVRFTIATGRMFRSALPYAMELKIELPLITYQGALIKDPLSGEILHHRRIKLDIAQEIAREAEELDYHLNAYIDDELLVKKLTPEGEYYQDIAKVPLKVVGSLTKNLTDAPTKLLVIKEEEQLIPLQDKWQEKYGQVLYLTRSKPNFLEVMAKGADKGSGVRLLANSLGIAREEILVIGDSYNDLEMFSYGGISVAMGNARREIQLRADYVTGTNEESGVAKAINKFVF